MRAGIAFGSNLGDRLASLRQARAALLALPEIGEPWKCSRVYETEPVGTEPGAESFLNAAMEVEFRGEAAELLNALQAIEIRLGRQAKRSRNVSRPIDLDLLYAGNLTCDGAGITIPHPRLHLRRFMLQPLCDICPDLVLPGRRETVAELLAALNDPARVELFAEGWD